MTILQLKVVWIRFMMYVWGKVYKWVEVKWVKWRIKLEILDRKGAGYKEVGVTHVMKYEPTQWDVKI